MREDIFTYKETSTTLSADFSTDTFRQGENGAICSKHYKKKTTAKFFFKNEIN